MLAAEPTERPKVIGVTDPIICSKHVIHALDDGSPLSCDSGHAADGDIQSGGWSRLKGALTKQSEGATRA
jgi:hypothetical protein